MEKIKSIQKKIEIACTIANITQEELAKKLGTTKSAWSQRMKTGKFSDDDFNKIAIALGAKYYSGFIFEDGTKVE